MEFIPAISKSKDRSSTMEGLGEKEAITGVITIRSHG